MKIPALKNFTTYITYITKPHNYKPTINYILNDEFIEVIQHQNFLFLPIHKNQTNHIELTTDFKYFDDDWEAIPIGIYAMMQNGQERGFITNLHNPSWLTGVCGIGYMQGRCQRQFSFTIDRIKAPEEYHYSHQHVVTAKHEKILLGTFEFGTPLLTYENNSWIVGYKALFNTKTGKRLIKFRTNKKLHINCSTILNTQNIFNYLVIGDKTIPMEQVYFIKKVHTIQDWIKAFYSLLALSSDQL